MKKIIGIITIILTPILLLAKDAETSLDDRINEFMEPITQKVAGVIFHAISFTDEIAVPFVLIWLVVGSIVFTWIRSDSIGFNCIYYIYALCKYKGF